MKDLGAKVLTKIENLISQIEMPQNTHKKTASFRPDPNLSFGKSGEEDKNRILARMSYSYTANKQKVNKALLDRVYGEEQASSKYKVTNKKTIQILRQKQIRPIYQRIDQILEKKQRYIEEFKKYQDKKQHNYMRSPLQKRYSFDKFNQQQLYYHRKKIDHRNRQRIKRKHFNQLPFVKKQEIYHKIPTVDQVSRCLSERRNLRKNYSENVFKRMSQYILQEGERRVENSRRRTKQQGGFTPSIDPRSRIMADNLKMKRISKALLDQTYSSKDRLGSVSIQNQSNQQRSINKPKSLLKVTPKTQKKVQKSSTQLKVSNIQKQKTTINKQNKKATQADISKKVSTNQNGKKNLTVESKNEANINKCHKNKK